MADSPSQPDVATSRLGEVLARRWIITRLLPGIALVVVLVFLVPALLEWKAANDARNAEPVGSATFREITVPPYPQGVLELTGQFVRVDHAARRAWFVVPFDFVDPIPAEVAVGDSVQVTCRVRWVSEGVFTFGAREVRVDVCRDIVRLGAVSG
jgi:hypothetical protein